MEKVEVFSVCALILWAHYPFCTLGGKFLLCWLAAFYVVKEFDGADVLAFYVSKCVVSAFASPVA
jgi:hypothetical protein